mmetsp:Transcript_89985/g.149137  ORF Transcript_89985/g.149137 Transcript_89985/m.149137 type:complete len:86 (+) Transcript_89985:48-305(+)
MASACPPTTANKKKVKFFEENASQEMSQPRPLGVHLILGAILNQNGNSRMVFPETIIFYMFLSHNFWSSRIIWKSSIWKCLFQLW